MINVSNLSLWFHEDNDKPIISNLSFQLDRGETMLLLGPSGSGKSTLTHCLNGIYPRELDGKMTGDVTIFGQSIHDAHPGTISKQVGVVFQDPESQFCMLTVEDEIAFGLENICTPPLEISRKIDEVIQMVDLIDDKHSVISSLSGGQKQKLALACVLALEPEILILDEPTANLDPQATQEFIKTIQTIKQKKSMGIIVIEHQLEGWVSFIDRSFILSKDGKCMYDGPLARIISDNKESVLEEGICLPKITKLVLTAAEQNKAAYISPPLTIKDTPSLVTYMDNSFLEKTIPAAHQADIILSASRVTQNKKQKRVLHQIDFDLYESSFVAIVGANGSGKTSLTKVLSGIETPTHGDILLCQHPIRNWKEKLLRKEIGYVFQNPEHQFITDTVFDEIAYSLRLHPYSESYIEEKVHYTLVNCQLQGFEHRHPYSLSQGQKRRLSVATMIVDEQKILFLDEPTFGQDAASTLKLMQMLKERHAKGTSIIMVTHDMDIVDKYADRVLVLENGEIIRDQSPDQLWKDSDLRRWHLDYPTRIQLQQHLEVNQHDFAIKST